MLGKHLAVALDPSLVLFRQGLTPDAWQQNVLRSTARQQLLLCTRQAGKSTATAALAAHAAVYDPGSLTLIGSPSLDQSKELFRKVKAALAALPATPRVAVDNTTSLELVTGSRIEALPQNEKTIRGYSRVALLILDEAARVEDPYFHAIYPVLSVSGGRLVALSTPFGQIGWFWEMWTHGGADWERTIITAHDCPRISPAFLEEARRTLGERQYRQEYLCSFEDRIAQLFSSESIFGAVSADVQPLFGSPMGETGRSSNVQPLFSRP